MKKKMYAIFCTPDYVFSHYGEFTLWEELEKIDWSSEYRYHKDWYYQKMYYKYWSDWDFDWFQWLVFLSDNIDSLFDELKTWYIIMHQKR